MQLSIVTTLYQSAAHLEEFHRRASAAAQKLTGDYELILVNDGSPDNSQDVALRLCAADPRVSLVELSRNFGHHKAIMTGLSAARGEWVLLIDCDLEEEPELLERFWAEAHSTGSDVVYGVQGQRKGRAFERGSGALFYWLINVLSTYPVPKNLLTMRLMRRDYVRSLVAHRDQELFLAGLWALTGYRQRPLEVKKHSRGTTTYSFSRKIWNLVNAVTSFSIKPLVFIFYLGCFISLCSGTVGVLLVLRRVFLGARLDGWASLMVTIWFLGGLSIFSLGVIGIYLSKIFAEVKPRPYTVVRSTHGPLAALVEAPTSSPLGAPTSAPNAAPKAVG
jgi:putative glycosyltransferase